MTIEILFLFLYSKYISINSPKTGIANKLWNSAFDIWGLYKKLKPINKKIFYHGPCQLRSHGMGQPAVKILRLIPNISLTISNADCCGIGGTFGYSKSNSIIS